VGGGDDIPDDDPVLLVCDSELLATGLGRTGSVVDIVTEAAVLMRGGIVPPPPPPVTT